MEVTGKQFEDFKTARNHHAASKRRYRKLRDRYIRETKLLQSWYDLVSHRFDIHECLAFDDIMHDRMKQIKTLEKID